jgi:hypothetical protein
LSGRLGALVLSCAGVVAYANSLSGPFIVDDAVTIIDNPHIRQLWPLWPLSRTLLTDQESTVAGRPLVNLSFAINYAIGGVQVSGYHLVNIVLHVLCALLLFGVVRRTLAFPPLHLVARSTSIALAIALLWLVHPLNTEAVDYVTQRTELMMGACTSLPSTRRFEPAMHPAPGACPRGVNRLRAGGLCQRKAAGIRRSFRARRDREPVCHRSAGLPTGGWCWRLSCVDWAWRARNRWSPRR